MKFLLLAMASQSATPESSAPLARRQVQVPLRGHNNKTKKPSSRPPCRGTDSPGSTYRTRSRWQALAARAARSSASRNPALATDAIGGTTKLAYDGGNRLASVTDPNNNPVERYSYDGRGRITGMTDRKGQAGTIEYDIAGRVARTVLADATMDYTYDAAGRMTELTETPTGAGAGNAGTSGGVKRVNLTYDILDRVTQEKHEAGGIITVTDHQYDALDRRTRRSVSASGTGAGTVGAVNFGPDITDYAYDDVDRLTVITYRGNGASTGTLNQTTSYQYDIANRLISKTFPDLANPSSAGSNINRITVAYAYDNASRPTDITYRRGDASGNSVGPVIEQISYQYDATGQRISKTTLNEVGNQETPFSATYNAANRMTAITLNPNSQAGFTPATAATYTLSYDLNGNLTTRQNTSPVSPANPNPSADTTTYTWDARNRLIQIQGNGSSAVYQYDAMGRRTQRNITQAGSATQTTTYLYDGLQAVGELKAQAGATPAQSTAFTTGLAIDEVIARYTTIQPSAGNPQVTQQARAYLTDALGTVMQQVREDQSTLNTYGYSPYGQSATAGGDEGNSIQYTGRENDGVGGIGGGGITFHRNRYYDSVAKVWLSEDPIGIAGGTNVRAYVGGDPVSLGDPDGLEPNGARGYCDCDRIASAAMQKLSAPGYGVKDDQSAGWGKFGVDTNKCNLFVCDVLLDALGVCPKRHGTLGGPLSAGDWADPSKKIPGFIVVSTPQPGDIVAIAFPYRDATGHVGIVAGANTSIYAAGSGVQASGWPWDQSKKPQGKPTFRRCVCSGG